MKSQIRLSAKALLAAASEGDLARTRELLAAGAGMQHFVSSKGNAVTEACNGDEGGWSKDLETRSQLVKALIVAGCPVEGLALFRPIARDERVIVQLLLEAKPNVNVACPWLKKFTELIYGQTPLAVAVNDRNFEIVQDLIAAGANPNFVSSARSPLNLAAWRNYPEIGAVLLAAGADVDDAPRTVTPLFEAVHAGNVEMVKLLAEAGADVNRPGYDGAIPLDHARRKGFHEIATILESHQARVPKEFLSQEALIAAAKSGRLVEVARMIAEGVDINAVSAHEVRRCTALALAAEGGHLELVEALLLARAKVDLPDSRGRTPLMYAATLGHARIIRRLGAAGADVNLCYREHPRGQLSSLMLAVENCRPEAVAALLELGADAKHKTRDGESVLDMASACGDLQVLELVLTGLGKVSSPVLSQALFMAASGGTSEAVQCLLKAGANPEGYRDMDGSVALMQAALMGNPAKVQLLLAAGARVDARDERGDTALAIAAVASGGEMAEMPMGELVSILSKATPGNMAGLQQLIADRTWGDRPPAPDEDYPAVIQMLLKAGADVNSRNKDGSTPLMHSTRVEVVKLLLEAGAHVNARNKHQQTAADFAAALGNRKVAQYLQTEMSRGPSAQGVDQNPQ